MTNERLSEEVRSLLMALRGELANMHEEMNARLTHIESRLDTHDGRLSEILANQQTMPETLEKREQNPLYTTDS